LKIKIAIAAMFLSAAILTPAHATTILLTTALPTGTLGTTAALYLSGSSYTNDGYIEAEGFDNVLGSSGTINNPTINLSKPTQLDVATETGGTPKLQGLGLNNSGDPYIGPSDAIVLDFSNVKTSLGANTMESTVVFNLYKDITGPSQYVIYGMSGANGTGTPTLLTNGSMASTGPVSFTAAIYSSYIIGITSDCSIDIQSVGVNYAPCPEPATFVMAGVALIGLGLTMRKRGKKA
jgi:hypothetical protein